MDPRSPLLEPQHAPSPRTAAIRRVSYLLSALLLVVSLALGVPLALSVAYDEPDIVAAFAGTLLLGAGIGASGLFLLRTESAGLSRREGFAVVALGWVMVCALGAMPYVLSGTLGPLDAWFESTSGFTTTGVSVIGDVDALPRGILFWRSMSQWLGGMGFVVLYVALFPLLGVGAARLYRAEVPGLEVVRLRPRISSSAGALWLMYLLLSAVLTILFLLGGMGGLEAVCSMFTVLSTGGFTVTNAGVPGYGSAYIEWLHVVFMWICATSFSLHWALLKGDPQRLLRNAEWRFFTTSLVVLSLLVSLILWTTGDSLSQALRDGVFMVVSTGTTTGLAIADYEQWATTAQIILFLLMFMGGCAGSTAGGMKAIRVQLFVKQAVASLFNTLHPNAVTSLRLGGRPVTPDMMRSVLGFMGLFVLVFLAGAVAVSLTGVDLITAMSASIGMLGSNGAGLGEVGPFDTYLNVHPAGRVVLSFLMLVGRLELITVLILFTPAFWRR